MCHPIISQSTNAERIFHPRRPSQDGDFCLGVWEHEKNSNKYKLHHFAWGGNALPNDPPTEMGFLS
jgi:hypothetical protein